MYVRTRVTTPDQARVVQNLKVDPDAGATYVQFTLPAIEVAVLQLFSSAAEMAPQISADDVVDLDVLRGPAAAFLYSYAANGVIHIRTMSGKQDAPD